jgi:hypothetical protein
MAYPAYAPTSRSFNAGDYQYKTFKSQNGKEVRILYGDKRTGMTLDLGYDNIPTPLPTTSSAITTKPKAALHLVHACPMLFAPAGLVMQLQSTQQPATNGVTTDHLQ